MKSFLYSHKRVFQRQQIIMRSKVLSQNPLSACCFVLKFCHFSEKFFLKLALAKQQHSRWKTETHATRRIERERERENKCLLQKRRRRRKRTTRGRALETTIQATLRQEQQE